MNREGTVEYYLKEYYDNNRKAKEKSFKERVAEWAFHTPSAECILMGVTATVYNKAYCYLMNSGAISDMRPEWKAHFTKVLTVDDYSKGLPDNLTMNIDPNPQDYFVMSIGKRFEIEPKFYDEPFIQWEAKHDAVSRISICLADNKILRVPNASGNIKYLNKFIPKMGVN